MTEGTTGYIQVKGDGSPLISDPDLRKAAQDAMKIQPTPINAREVAPTMPLNRLQTAMKTVDEVLEERGKTHGEYSDHAAFSQALKLVLMSSPNWKTMSPSQRETLDMIAHKIGRILAGDPNYKDHWTDIAGYARLVEQKL